MTILKGVCLAAILIVVSVIDIKHKVIPNGMVIVTIIIGVLFLGCSSAKDAILGMFLGGGLLFLLALIPGAIGGGDVKLMFALGLFLGVNKTLIALFLAFMLASIFSLILIMLKIKGRRDYIPFGPFLAIGSFVAFLL